MSCGSKYVDANLRQWICTGKPQHDGYHHQGKTVFWEEVVSEKDLCAEWAGINPPDTYLGCNRPAGHDGLHWDHSHGIHWSKA